MAIFPGEQNGPAGSANRVGDKTIGEQSAFLGNTVDARCLHQFATVSTDGLLGMIIGENDENIGVLLRLQKQWSIQYKENQVTQERCDFHHGQFWLSNHDLSAISPDTNVPASPSGKKEVH
jgi:hypothetical protein